MSATVSTMELRVKYPDREQPLVWATGTTRCLSEHACREIQRKVAELTDSDLDTFESTLRRKRKAAIGGYDFTIVPIEEEYDEDEED
jgi:hypothetical protein